MKHGIDQYMFSFQWDADTMIQIPDIFVYSIPLLVILYILFRSTKTFNENI